MTKPQNTYPVFVRSFLKRILPANIYGEYIGRHEQGSLQIWKSLSVQLKPQSAILDIGAFHGDYAMAARSVNRQAVIFAFEPNPVSAAVLRQNCAGMDITVEECAVTQKSGQVVFLLSSATSHVTHANDLEGQEFTSVRAVNLDDWASGKDMQFSLVKIDVEGSESDVLHGAQKVLGEHRPVILCEVLSDEAGLKVMEALPPGYFYYHIDENKGLSMKPRVDRKKWRYKNWLFVHETNNNLLQDVA